MLNVFYDRSFQEIYTYAKESLVAKMELLECNYITQVERALCIFTIAIQSDIRRSFLIDIDKLISVSNKLYLLLFYLKVFGMLLGTF